MALNVRSRSHQELYLGREKYSQIDKEALSNSLGRVTTGDESRYRAGSTLRALREGKDLQGREAQYTIEDGFCIMYGQKGQYSKEISEERSGRITC
ncbi:hypothetical protein TNCV_4856791 [Trichonephila clavipes]|nr:hypothetical protein TNCV_4856791 [Trichonephila clavipes]